jgi:resuscitation-promoting factor RpfB
MLKNHINLVLLVIFFLSACAPQVQQSSLAVSITADGTNRNITLPSGDNVQQALTSLGFTLSQVDRVAPPVYTLLTDGMSITVTRVREEFETQQVIVPFERQELRNESLLTGETRLIQAGQNGIREITVRHVFENGIEVGDSVVSETILMSPIPEIVMVGVQSPFAPITIPGKLVYLTGGNAWIMDGSTFNRRPLVTTGDLDGYIFSLSEDGKLLLFSRKSKLPADQEINTLWVVNTASQNPSPVSLGVSNVVHFAAWQPGIDYAIAYSTVEPRATAPGWQANNDLHLMSIKNGVPGTTTDVVETNAGGIYGWWGMTFAWSPDGKSLAYSRPDGIGLVDLKEGVLTSLLNITPLNTHGDWAWIPSVAWGSDNQSIFVVTHAAPTGLVSPEESPNFDLDVTNISGSPTSRIVQQTGMFAYPAGSSVQPSESGSSFLVAFWQAIFPTQSKTSRYQLDVMNSDGTNLHVLFPPAGQSGLEPRIQPIWAPRVFVGGANYIAIIYEGNLWIVDAVSGQSQQVTGDESTSQIDWK